MKITFILLIMGLLLFVIPNVNGQICSQAAFCGGTSVLECGLADGYCPEDYGDWTSCTPNGYGTKCTPCDPDCSGVTGTCGILSISYPNLPQCSPPNIQDLYPVGHRLVSDPDNLLQIIASASSLANGAYIDLIDNNPGSPNYGAVIQNSPLCNTDACTYTFIDDVSGNILIGPSTGGTTFSYQIYLRNDVTEITYGPHTDSGVNAPCATLSTDVQTCIDEDGLSLPMGQYICDQVPLNVVATSVNHNLKEVTFVLEREITPGVYENANPLDCEACVTGDCEIVTVPFSSGASPASLTYLWTSSLCDNFNYRIVAMAYDDRIDPTSGNAYVINNTYNIGAPPLQEPSTLLNLIFAKVKTWIL